MAIRDADGLQRFYRRFLPNAEAEVAASESVKKGGLSDKDVKGQEASFRFLLRDAKQRFDRRIGKNFTPFAKRMISQTIQARGRIGVATSTQGEILRLMFPGS